MNKATIEYSGVGFIRDIKITGETREAVEEAIDNVKGNYPPPGYGTWFKPIAQEGDKFVAYGSRQTSCD